MPTRVSIVLAFLGLSAALAIAGCTEGPRETIDEDCTNQLDDDGNGAVDCQDLACAVKPVCTPEICDNDLDEDGDGRFDCADPECAVLPACGGGNQCGNHMIDPGEECDGTDVGGRTCITQGFATGTLACDASCGLDTSACSNLAPENCHNGADDDVDGQIDCDDEDCTYSAICQCGDGITQGDEWCDGEAFAVNVTCLGNGFPGGTIGCGDDCHSIDVSGCNPPLCGDSIISNGESCDDGNAVAGDGCDAACQPEFGPLCATATPLLLGVNESDNSDGAQGFESSCSGDGRKAKIFVYTPASSGAATVVLNSAVDLGIYVRSDCVDAASELACASWASGTASDAVNIPVTAGVPVTVIVDTLYGAEQAGPFTLIVVQTP